MTLEGLYEKIKEGDIKELPIVIKGDVQGSVEALENSLMQIGDKNIGIRVIHKGVGAITESDVMLAVASNAVILGFNVKKISGVDDIAEREGVEIKIYGVIYEAVNDMKAALEGMLEPELKEVTTGTAKVKAVFKLSKSSGVIAGCQVVKGKIIRNSQARVYRGGEPIYKDKIVSLKRFKDDAKEVNEGYECGIRLASHSDIKEGDAIQAFQIEKITRRLET